MEFFKHALETRIRTRDQADTLSAGKSIPHSPETTELATRGGELTDVIFR